MYNEGISRSGDVLDLAVESGIVAKRGAYFRYGELLLGQGRENAKLALQEAPALLLDLENQIRETAGLPLLDSTALLTDEA
jgi:recombination protein RecA